MPVRFRRSLVNQIGLVISFGLIYGCNQKTTPECVASNPAGDSNPGNPENAIKDFKIVRSAMLKFWEKNRRMPIAEELFDWKKDLLPGVKLSQGDFIPEDIKFSDEYAPGRSDFGVAYTVSLGLKWDGKERMPLLSTDIYRRKHELKCNDGTHRYQWGGVIVTMWTDGTVTKTKPGDTLTFVENGERLVFQEPGYRVPQGAITMRDYYAQQNSTTKFE